MIWKALKACSTAGQAKLFGMACLMIAGLVAVTFAMPTMSALTPDRWPVIDLPEGTETYNVGDQIVSNGVPIRAQEFFTPQDLTQAINWFKGKLTGPVVEDHLGTKTILGQAQGDYYITIQLEAGPKGTRGVVSVSDVRATLAQQAHSQKASADWQHDLPADTKILNLISALDDGRASTYLLASNHQSDELNINQAVRALARRGYAVERKGGYEKGGGLRGADAPQSSKTVWFKSPGREATVMAFHDRQGLASIVINTIDTLAVTK